MQVLKSGVQGVGFSVNGQGFGGKSSGSGVQDWGDELQTTGLIGFRKLVVGTRVAFADSGFGLGSRV